MVLKKYNFYNAPSVVVLYLINAKHFVGYEYEVTNDLHCGGTSIRSWTDGTNTNYANLKGISDCEKMCNIHVECAGFVHETSSDICGHWKRGPLHLSRWTGVTCHKKMNGEKTF